MKQCNGCGSTDSIQDLKLRGFISCCPERKMETNEFIADLVENGLDNNTIIDHVVTQQQDIDALKSLAELVLRLNANDGLSDVALSALQWLARTAISK